MATTSRTRWILISALAGAVLIAAIALIIANRGGAKAGAVDRAADPASGSEIAATAVEPAAPSAPSLDQPAPRAAPPTHEPDTAAVETITDTGAAVTDHRANPGELHDQPVMPSNGKIVRVGGQFAGSVAGQVAPIARECASQIPADARGAKPVIQVQLTVTIKDGKMTIDDVDTQLTDVTGDQAAVKDCVKSKAASVSIDATGQPDVDHYAITMPMRVAS